MEKTDGILYLNGGGGGGGAACSRRRWRWREGVAAREEARARKKRAEGGGSGVRKAAYFYAQGRSIWQLLEDGELGWKPLETIFLTFSKKNKDGEEK